MKRFLTIVAVVLPATLALVDVTVANLAYDTIAGSLGATLDQISWISTAYILAGITVLPLTGWLAAVLGRKRLFLACIAVFTIGSVLCGLSRNIALLALFRAVQGLGGGALQSTGQALLIDAYPSSQRAKALSIYGISVTIGPMLGPAVGGLILLDWNWPLIFFINVPFGVLAFLFASRVLHDQYERKPAAPVNLVTLGLLVTGLTALQYALQRGELRDWSDDASIAWCGCIAVAALTIFAVHEWRARKPMVDVKLFRERSFLFGNVFGLVIGAATVATSFVLPLFIQSALGYDPFQAAFLMIPASLATICTVRAVPFIMKHVQRDLITIFALALFGVSLWYLGWFGVNASGTTVMLLRVVQGIAIGLWFVPLSAFTIEHLPAADLDAGSGLMQLVRQLGGSLGVAMLGTILLRYQTVYQRTALAGINAYSYKTQLALQQLRSHAYSWNSWHISSSVASGIFAQQIETNAAASAFSSMFVLESYGLFAAALLAAAVFYVPRLAENA
jgi:DHA2 family multidrug resistance protein